MPEKTSGRDKILNHFVRHTVNSDPGVHARAYDDLPQDVEALCDALHHLLLHMFWIGEKTYGITHEALKASGRKMCVEFALTTAEERLASILSLDPSPLSEKRPVHLRSIGCCRDFALMLTSILRHRNIPARVRTGVALYFKAEDGYLIEDHYVTEHWNAAEERWQLTDPQIDEVQRPAIRDGLNTVDLPDGAFLTGWELLQGLRDGEIPETVGFPPVNAGLTYGRNKLFADFIGLTNRELPVHGWWGLGEPKPSDPSDEGLMDQMIDLLRGIEENDAAALERATRLFRAHPRLKMPEKYEVPPYSLPFC